MTVRLLEVSVESTEPARWRWLVSDRANEIASGYETSRETAQVKGDTTLFELLSELPDESSTEAGDS